MHTDVMIRECGVQRLAAKRGHVATEAISRGVDRTGRAPGLLRRIASPGLTRCFPGRGRRVAVQAFRLVIGGGVLGIAMGVVAGHAIESSGALSVALAPGESGSLEPD